MLSVTKLCQGDGSFDNVVKRTVPLTTFES